MNAVSTTVTRATADDWKRFMRPVAMSVRNTPTEDDFRARIAAIAHAVAVPAAWLAQPWRQGEAMRKFQFWPSVSDVAELFEEDLRHARESADRRQRLTALPPPEPEERSPEAIAAVMAKARAFAAEMAGNNERGVRVSGGKPMSEGSLREHWERLAASGNAGAALRLKAMRVDA